MSTIQDYIAIYYRLKQHFEKMTWFKEEGWRCLITEGQQQCSFILDKPLWEQHQTYFVTWIGEHEIKRNNIKIALVIEEELSGRKQFTKSLEQQIQNIIDGWGYALRPQKRLVLCKKCFPLNKTSLFGIIESEFSNLKQFGTIIDQTLERVS